MQQAMQITRRKGKVVLVGDVGLNFERDPLYKKEIDFLISCSYGPGRYDQAYEQKGQDYPYAYVRWTENRNMQAFIQLIEGNKINLQPLVHHEISLEDVAAAYEKIKDKKALGVVLQYGPEKEIKGRASVEKIINANNGQHQEKKELKFIPAVKDCLRIGVIGAGGFAKVKLMPILAKMKHTTISAIVDADISTALNASRLYGARRTFVSDEELYAEDVTDVVVIASPHKFHCDQAIKALQQGKAVFLEKPMATDFEQFARLSAFLQENPKLPFCVDYNRSFAPFIQKIKHAVTSRHTPLVIHYRMNAGFIPKEHWVQTDIGAGRIIGEACHIFDLFCYLTDAKPIAVSVEALHAGTGDVFPTDNFSAQIRFDDGSICTLLYTALGHKDLGKERMEVFFDSHSIVMDDYKQLHGFGLPTLFNEVVSSPDKGHEYLLNKFFAEVKHEQYTHPIPLDRLHTVAELTLLIDKLACEGGGTKELS